MNSRYTPLVLIFFALVANQASASPRVEGLARCALNDAAWMEGGGAAAEPVAAAAALSCSDAAIQTDDLALAAAQTEAEAPPEFTCDERADLLAEAAAVEAGMRALSSFIATPAPRTALELPGFVDRAAKAIGSVIMVPLRYGCAVFGASGDSPAPPKKHQPRMLTLF